MLVHHFCAREPPFGPYEVMVFVLLLPSKEMTLLGDCTYLFHCHIALADDPQKKKQKNLHLGGDKLGSSSALPTGEQNHLST